MNRAIRELEKEDLLKLIEIYSKNWLAMDGVWVSVCGTKIRDGRSDGARTKTPGETSQ